MSYEIVGESVKSAMSIKLGQIFPDITRYKEAITTLKYPHFFIYQISMETIAQEKNRYILSYLMNIRYRYVDDVDTVNDLNQHLDNVALKLLSELDTISFTDEDGITRPVEIQNPRYEKQDGVLYYFCNVNIRVKRPTEKDAQMNKLNLTEEVK